MKNALYPIDFVRTLAPLLKPEPRVLSIDWVANPPSPTPPAPAGASSPVTVKAEFVFRSTYKDIDALSKAVDAYIAELQRSMPDYTITHDPFPWLLGDTKSLEISFDKTDDAGVKEAYTHIKLTFAGPNKVTKTPPAPGATP
jgi:hypothetical protein